MKKSTGNRSRRKRYECSESTSYLVSVDGDHFITQADGMIEAFDYASGMVTGDVELLTIRAVSPPTGTGSLNPLRSEPQPDSQEYSHGDDEADDPREEAEPRGPEEKRLSTGRIGGRMRRCGSGS